LPTSFVAGGQPGATSAGAGRGLDQGSGGQNEGALGSRLQGTPTAEARARVLGDRDFLLLKGTYLRASLDTRIDTTVPGFISATVTRDIYSDNGHVLLVERGTRLAGEYQNNMTQGQNRIFVLWTRLVTPRGVAVDLASPGTDALGGSGVDGRVNNHFWARYGGAFMLSVLSDGLQSGFSAAGNALSGGSGSTTNNYSVSLGNTQSATNSAVQEIIRSTNTIKPSLFRNQGDVVGVYIARDLDFSDVYGLAASRARRR
jgi:type IV secretion system protein VirB10